MNPKKIIIAVVASMIVGIIASVLLQEYSKKKEKEKEAREAITDNPFYPEFQKIGAQYNLNMDFTKKASCVKSTQLELEKIPLFKNNPKSCDVLIVGDSSMAWSIIPEIIEQMTGLKVGVFASEALMLNLTVAKVIDNLASYYLKDDGLLIISFGGWTQEQNANSMVLVYTDWIYRVSNLNNAEFVTFMDQWKRDNIFGGGRKNLLQHLEFAEYRNKHKLLKENLGNNYSMSLLQLPLYFDYIEPIVNPGWYKQKIEMKAKIKCFLRWNDRSITMYANDIETRSRHSESPPDPNFKNKDIEAVSSLMKKIKCRKAYQIHINFDDQKYAKLRSIYNTYYKDAYGCIDLGKEHPKNESYEMDVKEHTINSGGIYQSILIGKYLKENFPTLGRKEFLKDH